MRAEPSGSSPANCNVRLVALIAVCDPGLVSVGTRFVGGAGPDVGGGGALVADDGIAHVKVFASLKKPSVTVATQLSAPLAAPRIPRSLTHSTAAIRLSSVAVPPSSTNG